MNLLDRLTELYPDEQIAVMDGFDDCIVGVVHRACSHPFLLYDRDKVIQKLQDRDGMTIEDAVEYHEFNQACAWVGDGTPAFLEKLEEE